MDKILASHILIMHKESKDSRSSLSKNEAKKLIEDIYKKVIDKKSTFKDLAANILTVLHQHMEVAWENLVKE